MWGCLRAVDSLPWSGGRREYFVYEFFYDANEVGLSGRYKVSAKGDQRSVCDGVIGEAFSLGTLEHRRQVFS